MFLLYINDMSTGIGSSIHLFADDYVLYRVIKSIKDHNHLQEDLNTLVKWTNFKVIFKCHKSICIID